MEDAQKIRLDPAKRIDALERKLADAVVDAARWEAAANTVLQQSRGLEERLNAIEAVIPETAIKEVPEAVIPEVVAEDGS